MPGYPPPAHHPISVSTDSGAGPPPLPSAASYQTLLATFREALIEATGRKLRYLDLLATFLTLSEEDHRYASHFCRLKQLAGEIAHDTDTLITLGGALNYAYIA